MKLCADRRLGGLENKRSADCAQEPQRANSNDKGGGYCGRRTAVKRLGESLGIERIDQDIIAAAFSSRRNDRGLSGNARGRFTIVCFGETNVERGLSRLTYVTLT